ncbi:hypothetical protein KZJ38_26365 [Paraburkholderia edwinii]|jgi:hypothetical protein|uniref:Uncharacterized protein n=1 Tax=Paraburkholderia edwinii TaxID=2861782 RepID=A0ABX8UW17_9BURK|nr:hypothetical protein [Paraburkholderia edwinii]QYD73176.1 hypothetical protein KZJ38_26365 [Paraburkholderia edwinii]
MKKFLLLTTSVAALALTGVSTSAFAQSTGAQPPGQPASAGMAASPGASGEGPGMSGQTASGKYRTGWPWHSAGNHNNNCVGPISFCNVYFGGG